MGKSQYSHFRYQLTNLEYKWLMKGTREDVHPRNLNFPKLKIRKSKLYNRNDYLYMIFNSLMTFNNLILPHNYFCTHYTQEQILFRFQDDFQVLDLSHIYRCLYMELLYCCLQLCDMGRRNECYPSRTIMRLNNRIYT